MTKEILISASTTETRIAILEDETLVDFYLERPENERMVGDIYKGRVENVLPGMQAAFVNIGLPQNAFLHFSDVGRSALPFSGTDADEDDKNGRSHRRGGRSSGGRSNGEIRLKGGQDLIVQVIKEPIATKGARVTTQVSLPGRFMVLVPNDFHVGVSRKVDNFREKQRLKRIARDICPEGFGLIVRTLAEGKEDAELRRDLENLVRTWEKIAHTAERNAAPYRIYQDLSMASSVIRDLFSADIDSVTIENRTLYRSITGYLKAASPQFLTKVHHYRGKNPLFDARGVEAQIDKSLSRKVWLKSGGYIIIEHTEALVSIDVNSGRFIGKRDHEQNSLKVNLDAASEVARQLRLRDIGGLIVIDFIDMDHERNRQKVYDAMRQLMRRDRARNAISEISEFGLIEMTRQRIRPSLLMSMSDACPHCEGTGRVMNKESTVTKVERWLARFKLKSRERRLILRVHPDVAQYMSRASLLWRYWISVEVREDSMLGRDEFHVISKRRDKEITDEFLD